MPDAHICADPATCCDPYADTANDAERRERDRASECGCVLSNGNVPVRCAHFGGQVVAMWQSVFVNPQPYEVCGPADEPHVSVNNCSGALACRLTLEQAEAEFERREAEMLGRAL